MKLRELSNSQRVLAEKLVNDILFEAEMNNLTISHKLVQYDYGPHIQSFRINPSNYPETMRYYSASPSTSHSSASAKSDQVHNYPQTPLQVQTQFNNQ